MRERREEGGRERGRERNEWERKNEKRKEERDGGGLYPIPRTPMSRSFSC